MPIFRRSQAKPSNDSTDTRPLMYAASPSTPSLAPSLASTTKSGPEPYRDITKSVPDANTTSSSHEQETSSSQPEEKDSEPTLANKNNDSHTIHRPKTPPQGSNHTAWSSYRDLPDDHPVFRYPDEMREKMYAKGIDPVVKAEMDLARLGKVYGESHHVKGFWKRGTSMMGQFGTMSTGGAF